MAYRSKGKGRVPAPVYEATFSDGTKGRLSFWSENGKPIDFEDGRRSIATCYARPRDESGYRLLGSKKHHKIGPTAPRQVEFTCGDCRHHFLVKYTGEAGEEAALKAAACSKCQSERVVMGQSTYLPADVNTYILYPPKVVVDGYVEVDGTRVRDPMFDPDAEIAPTKRGTLRGFDLVESVMKRLAKDDSAEARQALAALRREFQTPLHVAA